jgi:radical SAM superfamily enzyme YgiQ (UPF0313 family)
MIAGGAAVASNSAALSRIFDVLVPGEAETTLVPILQSFLDNGLDIEKIANLPGVWVPACSEEFVRPKNFCNVDLEPAWSHIVSAKNAFGGAHIIEVMRGCPRICSFCLARVIYQPVRAVSRKKIEAWLNEHPDCRDLGLVAPSLFDHPEVEDIFSMLIERKIRIRNSSVKWEKLNDNILSALRQSEVRSLTIDFSERFLKLLTTDLNTSSSILSLGCPKKTTMTLKRPQLSSSELPMQRVIRHCQPLFLFLCPRTARRGRMKNL